MQKDIQKLFGFNPSKTTVFNYLGFTKEEWHKYLRDETRTILPDDLSEEDVRNICERYMLEL